MGKEQHDSVRLRTRQIVEDFVENFDKIVIKEEARSLKVIDPIDGKPTNLASLIGYLVSEYVRLTDAVKYRLREYDSSDPERQLLLSTGVSNLTRTMEALLQAIQLGRAHNLIVEGFGKEFRDLRQENVELRRRIEELSKQLKKCQGDFELYKKYVRGSKGNVEFGDVVKG